MSATEITRQTPYDHLPQFLTVREAAARLGTSTWFIREATRRGEMPSKRLGKFILVPRAFFKE